MNNEQTVKNTSRVFKVVRLKINAYVHCNFINRVLNLQLGRVFSLFGQKSLSYFHIPLFIEEDLNKYLPFWEWLTNSNQLIPDFQLI